MSRSAGVQWPRETRPYDSWGLRASMIGSAGGRGPRETRPYICGA